MMPVLGFGNSTQYSMLFQIELLPSSPVEEGDYPADADNPSIAAKICQLIDQYQLAHFSISFNLPDFVMPALNFREDFAAIMGEVDDVICWVISKEEPFCELFFPRLELTIRLEAVGENDVRVVVLQDEELQGQYIIEETKIFTPFLDALEELDSLMRVLFPKGRKRLWSSGYWS
jgi:hypothetical protein